MCGLMMSDARLIVVHKYVEFEFMIWLHVCGTRVSRG